MRVDRNARQKAELHVLDVVVGVEADDRLDERIGSHLIDKPLIMALNRLDLHHLVRKVHGGKLSRASSFDGAHEPVLRSQNEIQVFPGQSVPESLAEKRIRPFELKEEVRVKFRRNVTVMWLQILVFIPSQQARDALGEAVVLVAEVANVPQTRQLSASDCIHVWLTRSRGEMIPIRVSLGSLIAGSTRRRSRSVRSRRRCLCRWRLSFGDLRSRFARRRSRCR